MALNTKGSFHFQEPLGMHSGMLAEAFVSGQLHLKEIVDPDRLRSSDPLDPSTPYPAMFDLIIWNGRYYFPREPLPGLIRAIFLYTTGFAISTGVLVVTFAFGAFILLGVLLWMIRGRYFPESPGWMLWYIWISFALSGTQLYIASRPVVYNESIAGECFFVLAGCALLVHGLNGARRNLITACLSGMCFGAALACRAVAVLYPLCFVTIFLAFSFLHQESTGATMKWALSFAAPVGLWVAALLVYNFLRFGNPLDFGNSHVLFPIYSQFLYATVGGHYFSWKHVPYQLYYYLLSLPLIVNRFPYLRYPFEAFWTDGIYLYRERVCSVFIAMPVVLLSLPFPFVFRHLQTKDTLFLILVFLGVSCGAVLAVLSFLFGATARYYYDFTPILFVMAFCSLAVFWNRVTTGPRRKTLARAILVLLFIGNVFMGLLLGLSGAIMY